MVKQYAFYFESVKIPISNLTIRRRTDTDAFCSVTLPIPDDYVTLISNNPSGTMEIFQIIDGGSEVLVGTYTLNQVLPTNSPSSFTLVLNGRADFGTDQPSSGSYTITNPITSSSDTSGDKMFSAEENALIVVGDTIDFSDEPADSSGIFPTIGYTVDSISLFVTPVNSRMDVGII